MKTASYFTFNGPGSIGISLGAPRGMTICCGFYRDLAPRREMLRMPYHVYRDVYFREILGPLDPKQVVDDLQRLAGENEPVILCFERPPFNSDNWCHRRMAAEWLGDRLGLVVPEIDSTAASDPPDQDGEQFQFDLR